MLFILLKEMFFKEFFIGYVEKDEVFFGKSVLEVNSFLFMRG